MSYLQNDHLNILAIILAIYQIEIEFWNQLSYMSLYNQCPYIILYHWTNFQYQAFFTSQDIKQLVFLNFW